MWDRQNGIVNVDTDIRYAVLFGQSPDFTNGVQDEEGKEQGAGMHFSKRIIALMKREQFVKVTSLATLQRTRLTRCERHFPCYVVTCVSD